ncbi:MBL fold metallo-hydrolase [Ruegeria sp. R14_0]|uniref:MBL fold metallo-hydrolase n=1 Tax=Ruegeria sp. R14_0 TaxID=2821100 RepID=UPI001ADA3D81|nr:MBL fold metallo-hydrolase [Ruegeria sp. R14_0]MBO9447376.1 MBL fold metallo-hydrolase [Ruegeria sp. R14_0]
MTKNPTTFSRRSLIRAAAAAGLITPQFAANRAVATTADATDFRAELGTVQITRRGPVTLHTYMASDQSSLVTSHIVETADALYLVDCQFTQSHAAEFRNYVDSLGKPIRQVHISHPHPDHFSGYAKNFSDVPVVTTAKVRDVMKERWIDSGRIEDLAKAIGPEAPETFVTPEGNVALGASDWGGVSVNILEYDDAEAQVHSVVHIPEAKTLIVGDLAFANAHFFPLGNNANWINVIDEMSRIEDVELVLCGHGLPAHPGVFDDSAAYLSVLLVALKSETADEAIEMMRTEYPAYGAKGILNFINRLYA